MRRRRTEDDLSFYKETITLAASDDCADEAKSWNKENQLWFVWWANSNTKSIKWMIVNLYKKHFQALMTEIATGVGVSQLEGASLPSWWWRLFYQRGMCCQVFVRTNIISFSHSPTHSSSRSTFQMNLNAETVQTKNCVLPGSTSSFHFTSNSPPLCLWSLSYC